MREGYRNNLANTLREVRNTDLGGEEKKVAKDVLEKAKATDQYQASVDQHSLEKSDKKYQKFVKENREMREEILVREIPNLLQDIDLIRKTIMQWPVFKKFDTTIDGLKHDFSWQGMNDKNLAFPIDLLSAGVYGNDKMTLRVAQESLGRLIGGATMVSFSS
ncbi:MAG: hypothetical protein Q7S16_05885 [bacterium]|nr:hypothetical protein [bacterium]